MKENICAYLGYSKGLENAVLIFRKKLSETFYFIIIGVPSCLSNPTWARTRSFLLVKESFNTSPIKWVAWKFQVRFHPCEWNWLSFVNSGGEYLNLDKNLYMNDEENLYRTPFWCSISLFGKLALSVLATLF